ncbi:hypothetical protein RG47T_4438 [Mucilaginibacter polytrichastri]|uniref:Uncharacterized protein n=2 Tax=Mucilaginibacter polytrichastri TaxID=1302689 RepID=A0A1Q6A4M9_9SPHI|nr:hypothetical protein RG47T_4438 [Mucilaginibacter polytrichastri]
MLTLVFSVAVANSFAGDKTDKDKGMKCNTPGKSCCKKTTKATAEKSVKKTDDEKKGA